MKIIFFGSSQFAVESLLSLIEAGHEIVCVVTQPDRAQGRGMRLGHTPVKEVARAHQLPVYQPEDIRSEEIAQYLRQYNADMFVAIAYGKILPPELLRIPRIFSINLHASLLPKYRGAAPINWAIMRGEKVTGVTIIKMSPKLDAGEIIAQERMEIDHADTNITLAAKLSALGSMLLVKSLASIQDNAFSMQPQNESLVSTAPILKKEDGLICWSKPAIEIYNLVRGLQGWPGAWTHYKGKLLKIWEAEVERDAASTGPAAQVLRVDASGIYVGTGAGVLIIKNLQMEGGRRHDVKDFISGHAMKAGERFDVAQKMKKTILVLTDNRAGHQNQAQAIVNELERCASSRGVELNVERVEIRFRTRLRKRMLSIETLLIYPFIKKHISLLVPFIGRTCTQSLKAINPDIIIAIGSGTIPVCLLVSRAKNAKRIVLMKPSFPFNLFHYDVAVAPRHDSTKGIRGVVHKTLALSPFGKDIIIRESENLKKNLSHPERVRIGFIIGGDAKHYQLDAHALDTALDQVIAACKDLNVDFIVTTCRRTPEDCETLLRQKLAGVAQCQMLVLAHKEQASHFISAMVGTCSILITPEESISMISEPIAAGKKPIILRLQKKMYYKYEKFHAILRQGNFAHFADTSILADKIKELYASGEYALSKPAEQSLEEEDIMLRQRLSALL